MREQKDKKYKEYSRYAATDKEVFRTFKDTAAFRLLIAVPVILVLCVGALAWYIFGFGGSVTLFGRTLRAENARGALAGNAVEGPEPVFAVTETELPVPEETEAPETELILEPHAGPHADPAALIDFTEIEQNGEILEDISAFTPWYHMDFGRGEDYTDLDGVITFRGNNFRSSPAFGTADLKEDTVSSVWSMSTGALQYNNAVWTGSGWTGQPLMVKWPRETKAVMNMYDWAKEDDDLVEVIYACMDGYVYFMDLKTGSNTREKLYLGYTFKGAGALDPRGYPILYLGAGYDSSRGRAKAFIINLVDCSVMYTFGDNDPFSLRGSLSYFDSSALVDAASDTLIYPGESGILYLIHLNTDWDAAAGTLSIDPDQVVKWRYSGIRTSSASYWVGMETSAAVYGGYLFVADNGGNLMCLDLNTLELVWVQDTLDDTNSSPVLSMEDGHLYIYISTSFHLGWRSRSTAEIPIWKIDAETGEIVWQTPYECYTEDGVSGGVQSTAAVGEQSLSDYIYVTVSRTGDPYLGVLTCLDKKTGDVVWEHSSAYAWSSPVCVYGEDGKGRVLYCSGNGTMYLLDGLSGEELDRISLSEGVIEASPAVYDSYVVVGTRACLIWGLQLQ